MNITLYFGIRLAICIMSNNKRKKIVKQKGVDKMKNKIIIIAIVAVVLSIVALNIQTNSLNERLTRIESNFSQEE